MLTVELRRCIYLSDLNSNPGLISYSVYVMQLFCLINCLMTLSVVILNSAEIFEKTNRSYIVVGFHHSMVMLGMMPG